MDVLHHLAENTYWHCVLGLADAVEAVIKLPDSHIPTPILYTLLEVEGNKTVGSISFWHNPVVGSKALCVWSNHTIQCGLAMCLEVLIQLVRQV